MTLNIRAFVKTILQSLVMDRIVFFVIPWIFGFDLYGYVTNSNNYSQPIPLNFLPVVIGILAWSIDISLLSTFYRYNLLKKQDREKFDWIGEFIKGSSPLEKDVKLPVVLGGLIVMILFSLFLQKVLILFLA